MEKKGFEEFEPIFGKAIAESDGRCYLFRIHALDASRLRIHATDFHSYTWESVLSIQHLQDLRDDVGVGGSWSEFLDYFIASFKSDTVKLLLQHGATPSHTTSDLGPTFAKLISRRSKGMPLISLSLDRLMNSLANDVMANLSFELFNVFKKQEHCNQQAKNLSEEQEKNGSIQNRLDEEALFPKQQKLRKIDTSDRELPFANPSRNKDRVTITHESPEKLPTRKVGHRVGHAHRRAKVRGAVLEDTDDGEGKGSSDA